MYDLETSRMGAPYIYIYIYIYIYMYIYIYDISRLRVKVMPRELIFVYFMFQVESYFGVNTFNNGNAIFIG